MSDATDPIARFEARWQGEIVLAAVWREAGESNDQVSGGDVSFSEETSAGGEDGISYQFAADAADYLYTSTDGSPSPLNVDMTEAESEIESRAPKTGVVINAVESFRVIGDDVQVLASAESPREIDYSTNPVADPESMEGALVVITNPDGSPRYMWSYCTGLNTGHTSGTHQIDSDSNSPPS